MKLKNSLFLSRANLHGSKRKNTVFVMMIFAVIATVLLASYINIYSGVLWDLMNNPSTKTLYLVPFRINYPDSNMINLSEETKADVLNIEHVISVESAKYADYQLPEIKKITDENGNDVTNSLGELTPEKIIASVQIQRSDNNLLVKSLDGKNIAEESVMSCYLPDYGCLYYGGRVNLSELLGKTITFEYDYSFPSYTDEGVYGYSEHRVEVPIKYELKVAGIYRLAAENTLGPVIVISPDTAQKIENTALENADKNQLLSLKTYLNDPYSRRQYIKVDSYENIDKVMGKMEDLGLYASPLRRIEPATKLFTALFTGAGAFLLTAVMLLMCINIFLSVYANINARRPEIGLMKAVGYKNSQIFKSMYMENVILAVRALIVGLAISAIASIVVNAINLNSEDPLNYSYVMSWQMFGIMSLIALAMILTVPLICQLVMLNKITKIQPQEAMNS